MTDVRPLSRLEETLGFAFRDQALLQRSFVHRSYLNEAGEDFAHADNERLEFLGDSVLNLVVSELLFDRFPTADEGDLTTLRAALVRRDTLARFAQKLDLGAYLLLGNGEEESGGRTRPAILCATFEALLGALYQDQGIERLRSFLLPQVQAELDKVCHRALKKDPKSRLQVWAQSHFGRTPRYKTVASIGPDHDKLFTIQVSVDGQAIGIGVGRSKQEAAQLAAAMALHRLGQEAPEYTSDPCLEAAWPLVTDIVT